MKISIFIFIFHFQNKEKRRKKEEIDDFFLNFCTIKSPTNGRFTCDKGNSYHAQEMCEGVKKNIYLFLFFLE